MNRFLYTLLISGIALMMVSVPSQAQIPSRGSDFSGLTKVKWGMTIKEVKDSLGHKTSALFTSDTTLSYAGTLLDMPTQTIFGFTKRDKKLSWINIAFLNAREEDVPKLLKLLYDHYGKPHEKRQGKGNSYTERWKLKDETMSVTHLSYMGHIGLTLNYSYLRKHEWE